MLPVLNSAHGETKQAIIEVLTKLWPLSARNLYLEVHKRHFSNLTYQAIHKALLQLKAQHILHEENRLYSLNPDWILNLKRFTLDMETSRLKRRPPSVLDLPIYGVGKFESEGVLVEPYFWLLDQAARIQKKTGGANLYFFMRRAWPLIVLDDSKYSQFKIVTSNKDQVLIVNFDRFSDRYFLSMWKHHGFKGKTGIRFTKDCDVCVCGDYVFQIFLPKKTWVQWDRYYSQLDSNHTNSLVAHKVAFELKTKASFLFFHNPDLADQTRKEARSYF